MSNRNNNAQIPAIRPTQFEGGTADLFKDSVNLFRGDVNLSLDLVSLTGRNGLDLKVTATYSSNVKNEIEQSNVDNPTGILGLGWGISFERIEVDQRESGSANDNRYFLVANNNSNELVRNDRSWQRAALPASAAAALNKQQVDESLLQSLKKHGLELGKHFIVKVIDQHTKWHISDLSFQREFRIEQKDNNLVVLAGGESYECYQYDFSQIRYYPEFERWELIKDDGTIYSYGGMTEENIADKTIQWKVKWGNWTGESDIVKSNSGNQLQSHMPIAWNLATVRNIWNDTISFSYETVEQQVGTNGLSFTKACYIRKITDMFNRTVTFNYDEKEYVINNPEGPREFMSPNWNNPYTEKPTNNPGPYQDRYETRYLAGLTVKNEDQQLLYAVELDYDKTSNFTNYPKTDNLYGDTVKRTLVGIRRIFKDNCTQPGLVFSYWPKDGINAGALSSAITPEGATVDYHYKQQTAPLCDRQIQIQNPWPGDAKPRVWFGSDYVFTAWMRESNDEIKISIFTWVGRWQEWNPASATIRAPFDISTANAVTSSDFLVFSFKDIQNQQSFAYTFHKNNLVFGDWFEMNPIQLQSTKIAIEAGDNFFVACDQAKRKLYRYTWNLFNKSWFFSDQSSFLAAGNPNAFPYLTAANKHYAILDYGPSQSGEHLNKFTIFYQDTNYNWHQGGEKTFKFTIGGSKPDSSFGFVSSASFIAITYITQEVSLSFNYTVKVLSWDELYNAINAVDFSYQLPKSNPSRAITIPFIAGFVSNSMIASGPYLLRYNGERWLQNNNLSYRTTLTDQDISWFAYGANYAIFTSNRENACDSKLLSFDATINSADWNNKPVTLFTTDSRTPNRKIHFFPTAGVNIATMGNRVYSRKSQTNWANAVNTYQSLSADINSTTVINQGPKFLSYLNVKNEMPVDSTILPLLNQQLTSEEIIPQRYFTKIGTDGNPKQFINGQYPAGPSSLVTSLPLNKDFDEATSITIHRYLDLAIEGQLVDYCVDYMVFNNGYQQNTTKYEFDLSSATCDPGGTVFKYYKSRYYPGTNTIADKPFGYVENNYFNGLTSIDNPRQQANILLDGQLIERKTYDSSGKLLISEKMEMESFNSVTVNGVTRNLYGGYTRCMQNNKMEDGMLKDTLYTYDSAFGKLQLESFDNVKPSGDIETICSAYTYAFEAYDWFLTNNVIDVPLTNMSYVILHKEQNRKLCTSANFQSYSEWISPTGLSVWCTDKSYILQEEIPVSGFNVKQLAENTPGSEWRLISSVINRTAKGAIAQQQDNTGNVETVIWDKTDSLPIASFNNSGQNEAYFTGFESYEKYASEWTTDQPIENFIVRNDAHAGNRSFKLTAGTLLQKNEGMQQTQKFILSGWIKAEKGFNADAGNVSFVVKSDNTLVSTLNIIPEAEEVWEYWQGVVDFTGTTARSIALSVKSDKTNKYLLINNICVSPLVGEITAKFYDNTYRDEIAELGKNANTIRGAYDPFRQKTLEVGPKENTKKGAFSFTTRSWEPIVGFTFPTSNPNNSTEILAGKGGLFETFTKGAQIWNSWKTNTAASWSVDNASLKHIGNSFDQIDWQETSASQNYACSFSVTSPATTGISLGFSIGDKLSFEWHPDSGWKMQMDGKTFLNSLINGKTPVNLLFVPVPGAILFYADGRQVFSEKTTFASNGKLSLQASGEVSFTNIATFNAPQISMQFTNGAGKTIQSQVLDETRCLVKATLANEIGLPIVETKIAAYDGGLFGFRTDFITGFDKQTRKITGYINDYYPADGGYPYNGTLYEASSLGRMIKKGLPGAEFAITETNTHVTSQQYGVESQVSVAGIPFVKGSFLVMSTTDANGCSVYSIFDRAGNALGKQTNAPGGSGEILQAAQQVFDSAGNIIEIRTPNYFDKTGTNNAFVTTQSFNFLQEMVVQKTTDSGQTTFIYDQAGRIRFCQNPLSLQNGSILYKKYDVLGRITEEGTFTGEWKDGKELQIIADTDPNYPQDGIWDIQNSFDGDGHTVTLLGRIHTTKKQNAQSGIIENIYGYDEFGNSDFCSLRMNHESPQETHYKYDNLGNIIEITYPETSSCPVVTYAYNMIGQNTTIGTPQDPDKFAFYRYDASGSIANETMNKSGAKAINRVMNYTSPGWIKTIRNQYADESLILQQSFDYTSNGYEGAGYFNGNIARISTINGIDSNKSFDYKYKYDQRGQLTIAQHSADIRYSLGLTAPTHFDQNGNIQTLAQGETVKNYHYEQNTNKVQTVSLGDAAAMNFGYDTAGNIQSSSFRGISQISYNSLNNLPVSLALSDQQIQFGYNAQNQRVVKHSSNGSEKIYVHGLNDYPLLEITDQKVQYIYGIGGLLAMIKNGTVHFILKDQQGSTRAVIAESGTIDAMLDYMPFGQLIESGIGDAAIIDYRFIGQEFDTETGLYNYRARFYDTELGRFYSIDPKFQYGSPFVYCINNPLNLTDINGEDFGLSFLVILLIGAAIGATVGAGVAAYTGYSAGLRGGQLAGYIFAGAGIGAVAGALSAAGGVGAFAAGTAAAAGATTTAGGIAAGVAAGAAVGAVVGAGVGAAQGVSQHFVNDAFGVANAGSWQNSMLKGAVAGAVGGAIAGGVAGAGGAIVVQQAARYTQLTGASGWYQNATGNASRATQIVEAYNSFKSMAVVPLPSFLGRIPSASVQNFIYKKFSLPTLTAGISAGVKTGVKAAIPSGASATDSGSNDTGRKQSTMPQNTYNPSTSNTVAMQTAMIINPSYWKNLQSE